MQYGRAMVAFFLPPHASEQLDSFKEHFPPGSEVTPIQDYHITLAYMPEVKDKELLREVVRGFAQNEHPVSGQIGGIGRFAHDEKGTNPFYTSFDAPVLPGFRQRLVKKLGQYGFTVSKLHGFIPHCTMAYIPANTHNPALVVPYIGVTFDCVWLACDDDRERFSLLATETQLKKRLGSGANALKQVLSHANA